MILVTKDSLADERLAQAAADAREIDVRRTFRRAVGDTVAAVDRKELSAAVLTANETLVERAVPWDIFSEKLSEISFTLQASAATGISLAAEALIRRRRKLSLLDLTPVAQRAYRIIDRQSFDAVQGIAVESRAAVRTILKNGVVTGAHIDEIGENLTAAIGLNLRQAETLAKYQAALIAEGVPDVKRILMVGKRARKMLKVRGDTISRTEVMTAINAGKNEVYEELLASGVVTATEAYRVWLTAKDERVCSICGPANGQRQPIGVPFNVGGMLLMYPGAHARCRCTIILRLKTE